MPRLTAVLVGVAVLGTAALAASPPPLRTATAVCSVRTFVVAFDPKQRVVVSDGDGRVLGSASFTRRSLTGRCRRVTEPKEFVDGGLGREIRRQIAFRCSAPKPIRLHVNPIRDGNTGGVVGSALEVGYGTRFRVIASAVLKNKGDPYASRVYRARTYCKHGA